LDYTDDRGNIGHWRKRYCRSAIAGLQPLEAQMAGDAEVRRRNAVRENLVDPDLSRLPHPSTQSRSRPPG